MNAIDFNISCCMLAGACMMKWNITVVHNEADLHDMWIKLDVFTCEKS